MLYYYCLVAVSELKCSIDSNYCQLRVLSAKFDSSVSGSAEIRFLVSMSTCVELVAIESASFSSLVSLMQSHLCLNFSFKVSKFETHFA